MAPPRGSLRVETRLDIFLALLGASTRPIRGITRLVKLLFLAKEELGADTWLPDGKYYGYRPYKFGPFSADVYEDAELLEDNELIEARPGRAEMAADIAAWEEAYASDVTPEPGPDSASQEVNREFRLTEDGRKCAEAILASMTEEQRAGLKGIRERFDRMSLKRILAYVYTRYRDYTGESTIVDELELD